jgi:DNA-binding response OmpR family regulator
MEPRRREQIQRSLRSLAESYRATMGLMEQTLALLCEELSLDPLTYFQTRSLSEPAQASQPGLLVDPSVLSVTFRGKVCFLGNTLPFKFLRRLAQRPNTYVTYEDLLAEVWQGVRSDEAVRSVAKTLRNRLRRAGLADLAAAIDGTVPGHYALRLSP